MPLEQDISEGVLKHFPDLQRAYAPLESRLNGCGLASARNKLRTCRIPLYGNSKKVMLPTPPRDWVREICPLFDRLLWAREAVQKAFTNGIETTVVQLRRHLKEIEELPGVGATGELVTQTVGSAG